MGKKTGKKNTPSPPRPVVFHRQKNVLLDDATADRIEAEAAGEKRSQSDVLRGYIAAGVAAVDARDAAEAAR